MTRSILKLSLTQVLGELSGIRGVQIWKLYQVERNPFKFLVYRYAMLLGMLIGMFDIPLRNMISKTYMKKLLHAHLVLPASSGANYLTVEFLIVYLHFTKLLFFGPIVIGDVVGIAVNWVLIVKTGLIPISKEGNYWKNMTKKFLHSTGILLISLPLNYATVFFFVETIHFQPVWIIGPVVIGDVIQLIANWQIAWNTNLFGTKRTKEPMRIIKE